MHTNSTENANPLYLKESCTDLNNNQNGQRYSNRNSSKKSAVMTIAHNIRNLKYNRVLLEYKKLHYKYITREKCIQMNLNYICI